MKTFVKILVAILVVAALCGGIYLVLPETAQTFVKGNIQYRINDEAKKRVDEAKNSQIKYTYKDNGIKKIYDPGTTYGSALENKAKTTVWYYESNGTGGYTITFYGTKVSMDLAKYGSDGTDIDKTVKVVFDYKPNNNGGYTGTVSWYIDNEPCEESITLAVVQALCN